MPAWRSSLRGGQSGVGRAFPGTAGESGGQESLSRRLKLSPKSPSFNPIPVLQSGSKCTRTIVYAPLLSRLAPWSRAKAENFELSLPFFYACVFFSSRLTLRQNLSVYKPVCFFNVIFFFFRPFEHFNVIGSDAKSRILRGPIKKIPHF